MLNNEQLLNVAEEVANALHAFAGSGERGKTVNPRLVKKKILSATSRRALIDALTEIIEKDRETAQLFDKLVAEVIKMPTTNFPLFMSLLRFKYAVAST